jgi:preprotein translocase subunit SecB
MAINRQPCYRRANLNTAVFQTEPVMSETTPSPQPTAQPAQPLVVNIQYVKDLSFEVPGAPQIYSQLKVQPQVSINLDVQARRIQEGQSVFEVAIVIRAEAHDNSAQANGQLVSPQSASPQSASPQSASQMPTVFVAELTYAGVFTLSGLPDNAIEPVLLVECPRILFPFARNILSDVTRDGGFPPVLLQPIDFVALWQSRRAQAGAANPVVA